MVDFRKLRAEKVHPKIIDPIEIFRRLPKPEAVNDLYTSQADVLREWFVRRDSKDVVIKLHTGGGKTLVGMLIAQSIIQEFSEPVIYLCPTKQLVDQTMGKASAYSIPAVKYESGADFPEDFLSGKSTLICTYKALFNGLSKFGIRGGSKSISAAAIILDDAHVAFSTIRDSFSLKVIREKYQDDYDQLTNIFRADFNEIGKIGTFEDIISGADYSSILEVPYWIWHARSDQVRRYLQAVQERYCFEWPLLRDSFASCHVLISKSAFTISPILPLIDMLPTFSECSRRVYMSATIADDSALISTFDADKEHISKPIISNSLAGVGERMIIAPELTGIPFDEISNTLRTLATWASKTLQAGTIILTPSAYAARHWEDIAELAETTSQVSVNIAQLQSGESSGPFVFTNRYDGIDLPGRSCRVLIMSGLPKGMNDYDIYRANSFFGGSELDRNIAQRVEQGMGRGTRGSGDYCVVILTGNDLISWIGRSRNLKFLTSSTRAQLKMGAEISKNVIDKKDLANTVKMCLTRDKEWVEYHAVNLAELTGLETATEDQLGPAHIERKAFKLINQGYYEKAIHIIEKYCDESSVLDSQNKGWLRQLAARAAHIWGQFDRSQAIQQQAYAENHNLIRPQVIKCYEHLVLPGKQADTIISRLQEFRTARGYLARYEEIASHLVPEATSNQFEQALTDLGYILGFQTDRPEHKYGGIAPDCLWLIEDKLALIIEAKSRKKQKNALTKEEHGQLLNAVEWFKKEYPNYAYYRVSVHPNNKITKSIEPGDSKVLTIDKLNELLANIRKMIIALCDHHFDDKALIKYCDECLKSNFLTPQSIVNKYLTKFEVI